MPATNAARPEHTRDLTKSGGSECEMSKAKSAKPQQTELLADGNNSKYAASRTNEAEPNWARPCEGEANPG